MEPARCIAAQRTAGRRRAAASAACNFRPGFTFTSAKVPQTLTLTVFERANHIAPGRTALLRSPWLSRCRRAHHGLSVSCRRHEPTAGTKSRAEGRPSPHCEASLKGYRQARGIEPYPPPGAAAPAPGAAQPTGVGTGRMRRTVLLAADSLCGTAVTARVTTGLGTFASGPSGWCAAPNLAPLRNLKRSGGPLICTRPQVAATNWVASGVPRAGRTRAQVAWQVIKEGSARQGPRPRCRTVAIRAFQSEQARAAPGRAIRVPQAPVDRGQRRSVPRSFTGPLTCAFCSSGLNGQGREPPLARIPKPCVAGSNPAEGTRSCRSEVYRYYAPRRLIFVVPQACHNIWPVPAPESQEV